MAEIHAANKGISSQILAELHDVSLIYKQDTKEELKALDGVSFEIHKGEHLCVLGANGSGKSTLALVLAGLLAPDKGSVSLLGRSVFSHAHADLSAYKKVRKRLGFVFQNPDDQIVTRIVGDDVAFGPENLALEPKEIQTRVEEELHRVALDDFAHADPHYLSGGQKQRVSLAGALAMHPYLLILDEPSSLLDVRGRRSLLKVVKKLVSEGSTIIHITHEMEEALTADRIIVLDNGRIALNGNPNEVFSQTETLEKMGLELPFHMKLSQLFQKTDSEAPRIEKNTSSFSQAKEIVSDNSFCIRARRLKFSYAVRQACTDSAYRPVLDDVSFDVKRGELLNVIGQTGSGKSTLLRLIAGLDTADDGHIVIDGVDIVPKKQSKKRKRSYKELRSHIGYVMQFPERQLFAARVEEDIAFGPQNLHLSQAEVSKRVEKALSLCGLSHKRFASPFELSGGQQRMAAIAGVLAMNPDILVLDEPMAGLDPKARKRVENLLKELQSSGKTIIFVTHSMDLAAKADHLLVLNGGKIILDGSPQHVFSQEHERELKECGLGLPRSLYAAQALIDKKLVSPADIKEPLTLEELSYNLSSAGIDMHTLYNIEVSGLWR